MTPETRKEELVRFEVLLPAWLDECLREESFKTRRPRGTIIKDALQARYGDAGPVVESPYGTVQEAN